MTLASTKVTNTIKQDTNAKSKEQGETMTEEIKNNEVKPEKEQDTVAAITTSATMSEDSGDNDAVLVDHQDVEEHTQSLQIVSIGSEENGRFCLLLVPSL